MSSVQAEIEAIDAQIDDLRRQKALLKNLPVEPQDSLINYTVRAVLTDGSQTSWQIYAVKVSDYWILTDTRGAVPRVVQQGFTWQTLVKYMKPETYKARSGNNDIETVEISGPFVANEWVTA